MGWVDGGESVAVSPVNRRRSDLLKSHLYLIARNNMDTYYVEVVPFHDHLCTSAGIKSMAGDADVVARPNS